MRIFIGIDPGLDGAVVAVDETGQIVYEKVVPTINVGKAKKTKRVYDPEGMYDFMAEIFDAVLCGVVDSAVLEKSQAMRKKGEKQGTVSAMSTGIGFGLWWMALVSLDIRYEITAPQTWQKVMFAGITGDKPKSKAKIAAQRFFPGKSFKATDRCTTPHSGLIDAALMAEYGRRKFTGLTL